MVLSVSCSPCVYSRPHSVQDRSQGSMCGGHLHELLACFRQGDTNLREPIEVQSGQGLCLICCATPAPDDDRADGEPGP